MQQGTSNLTWFKANMAILIFCLILAIIFSSRALGQFTKAEAAYIASVNMVPNRFRPRQHLFNLYIRTNQRAKAMTTGNFILRMPVKIWSPLVMQIKDQIASQLIVKR